MYLFKAHGWIGRGRFSQVIDPFVLCVLKLHFKHFSTFFVLLDVEFNYETPTIVYSHFHISCIRFHDFYNKCPNLTCMRSSRSSRIPLPLCIQKHMINISWVKWRKYDIFKDINLPLHARRYDKALSKSMLILNMTMSYHGEHHENMTWSNWFSWKMTIFLKVLKLQTGNHKIVFNHSLLWKPSQKLVRFFLTPKMYNRDRK